MHRKEPKQAIMILVVVLFFYLPIVVWPLFVYFIFKNIDYKLPYKRWRFFVFGLLPSAFILVGLFIGVPYGLNPPSFIFTIDSIAFMIGFYMKYFLIILIPVNMVLWVVKQNKKMRVSRIRLI